MFKTEGDLKKHPEKDILFSPKIENALKKPTKAQINNLYRLLEINSAMKEKSKNQKLKPDINSVASLRKKIELLRLESEKMDHIQKEIKKKVNDNIIRYNEENPNEKKLSTLGGKTKRRNKRKNTKRRSTKQYRIQYVTTVKKRG